MARDTLSRLTRMRLCRSRTGMLLRVAIVAALIACTESSSDAPRDTSAARDTVASLATAGPEWRIRKLDVAPARFRPGAWSGEDVLWGLVGGRLTRLDTRTGAVRTLAHEAWSIHGAQGVVSWRNGSGTWMLRDGAEPVRIANERDALTEFDGPPTPLWRSDGERALLAWRGEWDAAYDLVERDGTKRRLTIALPDYYGNDAALWLDSTRVLFHTVAKGPVGGEPEYRESGWRGNLAVFDVRTGEYKLVASVPDSIFLRVAGPHPDGIVVTEFGSAGVRRHWLYDPATWQRRSTSLPRGRAFASRGGAIVILLDNPSDTTGAVLVAGGKTTQIGRVPRDGEPAFSPSGRRGAIRTAEGTMLLEQKQE